MHPFPDVLIGLKNEFLFFVTIARLHRILTTGTWADHFMRTLAFQPTDQLE